MPKEDINALQVTNHRVSLMDLESGVWSLESGVWSASMGMGTMTVNTELGIVLYCIVVIRGAGLKPLVVLVT